MALYLPLLIMTTRMPFVLASFKYLISSATESDVKVRRAKAIVLRAC